MKNFLRIILIILITMKIFEGEVFAFDQYEIIRKRDILSIFIAYPDYISNIEKSESGDVFVVLKSGKKVLYDDKRNKSHEEKLINPDIQDMLEQIYPLHDISKLSEVNFDPGRGRCYKILEEVYGSTRDKVEKNLTSSKGGQFNKENKAAESLNKVLIEVNSASKNNSKIGGFVYPINGTYNYRTISGTGRLSPHAFGIAIDIKSHPHDYWKWNNRANGEKRMLSYPRELIEIFERNNFVWGGKWGHFDILHFEYRPEIIIKAKYFSAPMEENEKWYECYPNHNEIKDVINKIDMILGE